MVVDSAEEVFAVVTIAAFLIGIGRWIARRERATVEISDLNRQIGELERKLSTIHSDHNNWKNRLMHDLEKKFASKEMVEMQLRAIQRDVAETRTDVKRMTNTLVKVLVRTGHVADLSEYDGAGS